MKRKAWKRYRVRTLDHRRLARCTVVTIIPAGPIEQRTEWTQYEARMVVMVGAEAIQARGSSRSVGEGRQ